jgi:hypothetical protein
MKSIFQTLYCVLIVATLGACGAEQTSQLSQIEDDAYIRIPTNIINSDFVKNFNFQRDHKFDQDYAFGYLPASEISNLESIAKVDVLDAFEWTHFEHDARTLERINTHEDFIPNFEDYHHYPELTTELEDLADQHPNLMTLHTAGTTSENRELWYVVISDNANSEINSEENEPKLLYIANMHGDETVGRELMIYQIRRLLADYGSDTRVTNLVNNSQIFIMPSMNPDGFERSRRSNGNGSDLNRDFPDFTVDPDDTPNGRQPETQAVMQLHQDHHFVSAINFHGGAICFNMPWDTKSNRTRDQRFGDDPLMLKVARQYADASDEMRNSGWDNGITYGYEWYEVDGGMQDWASYYRSSFHATIELSNTKYPSASKLPGHWDMNKESLLKHLENGTFGLHLKIVDSDGELIESPSVNVSSAWRNISYKSGFIHRPTVEGIQQVTISAAGYVSAQITMYPSTFDGSFREIFLESK